MGQTNFSVCWYYFIEIKGSYYYIAIFNLQCIPSLFQLTCFHWIYLVLELRKPYRDCLRNPSRVKSQSRVFWSSCYVYNKTKYIFFTETKVISFSQWWYVSPKILFKFVKISPSFYFTTKYKQINKKMKNGETLLLLFRESPQEKPLLNELQTFSCNINDILHTVYNLALSINILNQF